MYIGTTDSRGLMHCLWEIIDNSVDEALAGYGTEIVVNLHADGSVTVSDQGRGIPVDKEPKTGLTGVELVFTKLHAGGKFGGGGYASSGGLHGVGASVVNALSSRLDVEVDRDGKTWGMSFRHGVPGTFAGDEPDSAFTPFEDASSLREVGRAKKGATGTRVRYWADPQIFLPTAKFEPEALLARARQTAFLVPGLALEIIDERSPRDRGESRAEGRSNETVLEEAAEGAASSTELPIDAGDAAGPTMHRFQFDGGISEFVEYLAIDSPVTDTWRISESGSFTETVPVMDEETGHLVSREVERHCEVDIALRWGTGYDTDVQTFVNIIATPKGGTHLSGFEQGLTKFFRSQIEANARRLKAGSDRPDKGDILTGLTAVVTVRLPEPQFEGQTKEVLGTAAVRQIVAKAVQSGLKARYASSKRDDKTQSANLLDKIVAEMKSRISLRAQRDTARRKNSLENSSLPAKLIDCRSNDIENTELFIVEGDSALGTARPARDSEYQALLPIRGKILNVQKASVAAMLGNAECGSIIKVIGAGSGRDFDLGSARYGKVILMSDADVDGAHIRILLLTLFFRYMRPMLDAGRVYAAVPPLHRVVVQHAGRKPNEVIYTYSERELSALLADLKKRGKKYQEPIQRYKGLGEMDAEQLAETTMEREHRTLRRVQLKDAHAAAQMFELLMGNDVAPRKEFIVESASELDRDRIDA